jgi:hypothetical protein
MAMSRRQVGHESPKTYERTIKTDGPLALLDADGDGKTTMSEVQQGLASLDDDGDGKISWGEYIAARKAGILTGEENAHEMYLARMAKIKEIITYAVFMCFFSMQSCRDLNNANMYYFGKNLRDQFTGEMLPEHSPQFNKNFAEIGTVQEFFHFISGPVAHTVYSAGTFDGDEDFTFSGGERRSSTLGYGQLLGAVRISQVRSKSFDCNFHVSNAFTEHHNYTCYGRNTWFNFGDFSVASELTEDFGNYTTEFGNTTSFRFDGIQGWSGSARKKGVVEVEREKYMSKFKTKKFNTYPSPGYAVLLPPSLNLTQARQIVTQLAKSRYVDLHTRALFVDVSVYNPMLDRICHCRMIGEITSAGGLLPTFDFQVVRLWERVSFVDELYAGLTAVVGCFYAYYIYELWLRFRSEGAHVLRSFLGITQIMNVFFFFASVGCIVHAERKYLKTMNPMSEDYYDLGPSIRFKGWAVTIQAINVFLNWFKLISILGYSSTFALVNETIHRSASAVAGFLVAFFIIFYGFSQTHCKMVMVLLIYCALTHCALTHCTLTHCAPIHCALTHCTPIHCTPIHCAPIHCTLIHCAPIHCRHAFPGPTARVPHNRRQLLHPHEVTPRRF